MWLRRANDTTLFVVLKDTTGERKKKSRTDKQRKTKEEKRHERKMIEVEAFDRRRIEAVIAYLSSTILLTVLSRFSCYLHFKHDGGFYSDRLPCLTLNIVTKRESAVAPCGRRPIIGRGPEPIGQGRIVCEPCLVHMRCI